MEGVKFLGIYNLRNLKTLNGESISSYDLDLFTNKKINQDLVFKNGMSLTNRPRKLKYSFVTDYCKICKTLSPIEKQADSYLLNPLSLSDSNFALKVTALCLDSQSLFKISNLSGLVNLRWASFNNNFLSKIEGLEFCVKLEELSLENNYLKSLDGLEQLKNLRKLNVSNNEIEIDTASLNEEAVLLRLSYLAINNNKIKILGFVQRFPAPLELYANFNQIDNIFRT